MAKPKVPGAGPTADDGPRVQPTQAKPIKVRAIREGYYEHLRRFPGDVFEIRGDVYQADVVLTGRTRDHELVRHVQHHAGEVIDFSAEWMERVDDQALPLNQRTAQQILDQEHETILRDRIATSTAATGAANPLGS